MNDADFHKQKTLPDLDEDDLASPVQPKKIGPYKIESLLSKGGMSLLYLGIHPSTSEPLAIKVLLPKFFKNKEMADRFLKEAQIIAMSNHPNIVKLYGQGQWEQGLYIAMEFIQGISLRQFIQQKSLSHRRALEIILQVAYALCHLHTHGVIHRDLKPENILITESGEIKVIDFGIAQLHEESAIRSPYPERRLMGTPVYMSPEQKENSLQVTYASDIYALGIIAYELVLGRLSHGVIHLALLPKNLRKIIEKALKPNLEDRYTDIVDFITDVSQYLKTLQTEQPPLTEEEVSNEMLDLIEHTRSLLIQKKNPRWAPIEMGLSIREGESLSGLYLECFRLNDNRFGIILAEPIESGVASMVHTSIFRGMVRLAMEHYFQNGKKEQHPIKMLHALNRAVNEDPMKQTFSLSLLILNPDQDQLSFVSCQGGNLWHIPEGSSKVRFLNTPNGPLGKDPHGALLETADNWNSGDTLIVHSSRNPFWEDPPGTWFNDWLLLSPQAQADKLHEQMSQAKSSPLKRSSAIIALHRIF